MLALTGTKADGWLPSMGYLEIDALPAMNAAIDEAAAAAGRRPDEIRRLLNINGAFGTDGAFLQGGPHEWSQQLAELTLITGMSTYILSVSSADDVRRFAEEVAPAVRELVATARGTAGSEPEPAPVLAGSAPAGPVPAPLAAEPTPDDGRRLSLEQAWDEASRPQGPAPIPRARTPRRNRQPAGTSSTSTITCAPS